MAALTANLDTGRANGKVINVPVGSGKTVYQGAMLVFDGAGNVQPASDAASSPTAFAGVARTGPIVGGGVATDPDDLAGLGIVDIEREGTFLYGDADSSPYVGQVVYAVDDNNVTGTAPSGSGGVNVKVGAIVEIPATGFVRVQIDNYVV